MVETQDVQYSFGIVCTYQMVDSTIIYDEGRQLRLGLSILTGILSFLAIEKLFDVTQVI